MTTMSASRSFYLSEEAERIIAEKSAGGEGRRGDRSGALDAIIQRYSAIIEAEPRPSLTEAEWRQLVKILEPQAKREIWTIAMLQDVIASSGGDPQLMKKIAKMTFAQRVAVVDVVERRLLKSASAEKR
jgi:uncharacterized protein (DUF1778 family)